MREIIYLRVDKGGVRGMTKSLPTLHRGEIPVKLDVRVDPSAFREPVLERVVEIADWRQGVDLADVEFRHNVITEAEAEQIRQQRLDKMREVLEAQGYTVTRPESDGRE